MGKERTAVQRISLFIPESLALQLKESAYMNRQTMTAYVTQAIVERIKRERQQQK